jgi:hypothetical protein
MADLTAGPSRATSGLSEPTYVNQLARTAPDATSDARACERPGVLPGWCQAPLRTEEGGYSWLVP